MGFWTGASGGQDIATSDPLLNRGIPHKQCCSQNTFFLKEKQKKTEDKQQQ